MGAIITYAGNQWSGATTLRTDVGGINNWGALVSNQKKKVDNWSYQAEIIAPTPTPTSTPTRTPTPTPQPTATP